MPIPDNTKSHFSKSRFNRKCVNKLLNTYISCLHFEVSSSEIQIVELSSIVWLIDPFNQVHSSCIPQQSQYYLTPPTQTLGAMPNISFSKHNIDTCNNHKNNQIIIIMSHLYQESDREIHYREKKEIIILYQNKIII